MQMFFCDFFGFFQGFFKLFSQKNEKSGKIKANPLIAGAAGKVYHSVPHDEDKIPPVFSAIDNDLAVENFTNDFDMTAADMQDLQ